MRDIRYGYQERVVLILDTDKACAIAIGEWFRVAIHALKMLHVGSPIEIGERQFLGVVPGVDSLSAHSLIDSADKALYIVKEGGRNQVPGGAPNNSKF